MKWYQLVPRFFGLVLITAIVSGYLFDETLGFLGDYVILFLAVAITISFLSIDLKEIVSHLKKIHLLIIVILVSKVALPAAIYYGTRSFDPVLSVAFLLVVSSPVAIIAPTLTTIVKGDTAFVMLLVVVTTLLAPIQLPLMMKVLAGETIQIDVRGMMFTLLQLILVPFALTLLVKRIAKKPIKRALPYLNAISVLLIACLIAGVIAKWAFTIEEHIDLILPFIIIAYALDLFLACFGYFGHWFLNKEKRIGLAVAILYMNIGLDIVIASEFFSSQVLLFCIVFELPINTLPIAIKRFTRNFSPSP
jgi:bile acid:Na+ symporter, BASS family